jgi:hypothetical protein
MTNKEMYQKMLDLEDEAKLLKEELIAKLLAAHPRKVGDVVEMVSKEFTLDKSFGGKTIPEKRETVLVSEVNVRFHRDGLYIREQFKKLLKGGTRFAAHPTDAPYGAEIITIGHSSDGTWNGGSK